MTQTQANYRYYRKNRHIILEKQRKYRLENRDRILARRRELYRKKKRDAKSRDWPYK